MKKIYFLLCFSVIFLIYSCENSSKSLQDSVSDVTEDLPKPSEFVGKYAGGYTVELDNISTNDAMEVYILKNDGTAKWMYLKHDGSGGANIASEKPGFWIATETTISITCEGNSGQITENFILERGRFYDTLTGDRYLKAKP